MDYELFTFPMIDDGLVAIERKLHELEKREKQGDSLDQVEQDWLDYANGVIMGLSGLV
jgi:hypothetical protein